MQGGCLTILAAATPDVGPASLPLLVASERRTAMSTSSEVPLVWQVASPEEVIDAILSGAVRAASQGAERRSLGGYQGLNPTGAGPIGNATD